MSEPQRILITTASFGEGHNTAAKNLARAFEAMGATARVVDPFVASQPRLTAKVETGYRWLTTQLPSVWGAIYRWTDRMDMSSKESRLFDAPERALAAELAEYQPHAVVSTYPMYPYFLEKLFVQSGKRVPVFTVVTDSIEINAVWTKLQCDRWLVTDPFSVEVMNRAGVGLDRVWDVGFAVAPVFAEQPPLAPDASCNPFRILFFPTKKSTLASQANALLEASEDVRLTIVTGKSLRAFYPAAAAVKAAHHGRVRVMGWTRKVPQLLNSHHLVVGKAGGATVHEAIAAQCPMLIHQLVPGQEEGNLKLLEALGAGALADKPDTLRHRVRDILSDDAAGWHLMKRALAKHARNSGAQDGARKILDYIQRND